MTTDSYSKTAKMFHWLTFGLILVQVPVGKVMTDRAEANIWDGTTNALYSLHKVLGFTLLLLTAARLAYRLIAGAPAPVPTLTWYERLGSELVHWALYGLLFAVTLLGWAGVSAFPALAVFDAASLPSLGGLAIGLSNALSVLDPVLVAAGALKPAGATAAERLLAVHKPLAMLLVLTLFAHVGAALFHHIVRKDAVLRRMLP